jgi:hypothetical protein
VQIPFRATRRTAGQTVDRRVVSISINEPIESALFSRPSS